jgi:2,4-didehydro-3-deoxy-L-rhamnonate hydrolase
MYLMRIGEPNAEKPIARITDDAYVDLGDLIEDFNEEFFRNGDLSELAATVGARKSAGRLTRFEGERIGSPVARPHQVRLPRGSTKVDWEVELGIVIGRQASYLGSPADAPDFIAGWTIVNDVSERAWQMERNGQWMKGKSAETFSPTGPWLVTQDEVEDVSDLNMWLELNGVRRQTGNTSTMIFDPYFLVHYVSQFMVLEPGDLISTGTPPGVGMGFSPQVWLQEGDVMDLSVEGLGSQRQNVVGPR